MQIRALACGLETMYLCPPIFLCRIVNLEISTGKCSPQKTAALKTPSRELIIVSSSQFRIVNDFLYYLLS